MGPLEGSTLDEQFNNQPNTLLCFVAFVKLVQAEGLFHQQELVLQLKQLQVVVPRSPLHQRPFSQCLCHVEGAQPQRKDKYIGL